MRNTADNHRQNLVFKLELEPQHSRLDCSPNAEEKDSSETLPFPEHNIPLAVPMMAANTTHSSVTRNDAKKITQSRLKRLRDLAQRPDDSLSKNQKTEKKRIFRLEKNRRAAAMSRKKKKMYVKNMEEESKLMARHIAILEMENANLRAFLNLPPQGTPMRPGLPAMNPAMNPMWKMQQFPGNNMSQFMPPSATPNVYSASMTQNSSSINSLEPPSKRRKLNGKSDSEDASEMEEEKNGCLEPVPLPINSGNAPPVTPMMQRMMPMIPPHGIPPNLPPNMMAAYQSRMNGYPIPPPPPMMMQNGMLPSSAPSSILHQTAHRGGVTTLPEIGKLDGIILDRVKKPSFKKDVMEQFECKSLETDDDAPPEVHVPDNDFCDLSLLGDNEDTILSVIEGTVDEYGSVLDFPAEIKSDRVYL